ncbi:hypothetical protein HGRIS_000600 [Hohenbuehelia grisea]|uniref:Uncharacterized protein n=1 Tax=Hohenbuehelia grisea TaxID=104357 RepID=A0ABR3JRG9_9AGAR
MFRSILATVALFLAIFACQVAAAPIATSRVEPRQIGNLTCNLARLRIVGALGRTGRNMKKIDTNDAAAATAVSTASTGLGNANAGVATIARAIFTGQQAPASARDQVGEGMLSAQAALQGMGSSDPNVAKTLSTLGDAIKAGQDVVANCK